LSFKSNGKRIRHNFTENMRQKLVTERRQTCGAVGSVEDLRQ
jgi:hypothetical protein